MCQECIELLHYSQGDSIFLRGDAAKKFMILKQGTIEYTDVKRNVHEVHENHWLAEAVLWTLWVYHGNPVAGTEVNLMSVDSDNFQKVAVETGVAFGLPSHYAHMFVDHMNHVGVEELTDLQDDEFDVTWATHLAFMDPSRVAILAYRNAEQDGEETEHDSDEEEHRDSVV